jgi:hypothetical protein
MPFKTIRRIRMPSDELFFAEHIATRTPVIITDLFEGQPIREIKSQADASLAFGEARLTVGPESSSAVRYSNSVSQTMSFNEYWRLVDRDPSTNLLCSEYEIPSKIMALFHLPSVCTASKDNQAEILDLPSKGGDFDLHENVFLANKNNKAHLHYDGDHRQVLLYQVFGIKRVILFEPKSGINLKPLDGPYCGASGIFLDRMSEDEKLTFVESAEGFYDTLYPGEAIYIPPLMWHYLEYVNNAMSFNIRFGRNIYGRFMCIDNFHRDYYIQNFAYHLGGQTGLVKQRFKVGVEMIVREYLARADSLLAKIRGMRGKIRQLCGDLCPEAQCDKYCPPDREQDELQRILSDIGQTMRYADPKTICQTRPAGMISSIQKRQLESKAATCGLSGDALEHLLANRIGKSNIDSLTKTEAALFLSYLRSPGAGLG